MRRCKESEQAEQNQKHDQTDQGLAKAWAGIKNVDRHAASIGHGENGAYHRPALAKPPGTCDDRCRGRHSSAGESGPITRTNLLLPDTPPFMSDLIGSVANLTGYRDRDLIDSTFVSVLGDWLDPMRLNLYRCVGDGSDLRLLLQAGMAKGQGMVAADPSWTPLEALPQLSSRPQFEQAFAQDEPLLDLPLRDDDGPWLNLFAVWAGPRRFGIIELVSEQPLLPVQLRLVTGLLRIYRNQITLLDYSERDSLTGLLNRKTFDEQFLKCIEPTKDDWPLSWWLGVIDIDHFKRVNDNFGHLIGDEVLLLVARLLRSAFRQSEQLYRFGGEEFIVLLRAEHEGEAMLAFEFFREQLAGFKFPQVGTVTASVGFTRVRAMDNASSAVDRGDRAVYYAKNHGRNQVHSHEALLRSEELLEVDNCGEIELF
ncbi:MAG: GGDEF domain-containing protein [Pseudomonadota bacterium]